MRLKSWGLGATLLLAGSVVAQPVPAYQNLQNSGSGSASGSSANAELYSMIQQLQQQVRQLNGQLEEQQHRLDQLESQAKSRYIDLDQRILNLNKRLAKLSSAPAASAVGSGGSPVTSGPGATSAPVPKSTTYGHYAAPTKAEQKEYDGIRSLIEAKQYDKAIDQLFQFLSKYPKGDLTVNAYYWLGEVYLAQGHLEQAQQAFTIVSTRYSDHRKAPDALYKLGIIAKRQKKIQDAEDAMKQVIQTYPGSHAAGLAKDELKSLDAAQ